LTPLDEQAAAILSKTEIIVNRIVSADDTLIAWMALGLPSWARW
jgi:hypothetical protein